MYTKKNLFPAEPPELKLQLKHLVDLGVVEFIGRGRSIQYMLCQKYYLHAGKSGVYTRKRGLDRNTNKELLLKHIRANEIEGARLADLRQVLPSLSENQVQSLLRELRAEKLIHVRGKTKAVFGSLAKNFWKQFRSNSEVIPK